MSAPTSQQRDALKARGNVLVAAGAGTGKTSTITARCLDLIVNEPCSLHEILMVTFTEAAAAEMRERLRRALYEQADNAPNPDTAMRLAEELALLDTAPISTLHGFCLELVRRNFHALELDPQFTVLDEAQTKPLMHAVLDELFERQYAGTTDHSASVRELIRQYGNGRDEAIRRLVVEIHRHTQALASPQEWFDQQMAAFHQAEPTAWRESFVTGTAEWARLWRETIEPFAQGSVNVRLCASALDELLAKPNFAAAAKTVAEIVAAHEMKWDRLKKDFRDPIKSFFTEAAFLRELTDDDGAPLTQDWSWVRGPMLTLLTLAREFGEDFAKAKRELGGIDFADQEQFALRLLRDDAGRPTPIALACRERFRFVFVDECQDINAAQDAILRAVSREGAAANRFLVGDVKQSIYRFRLADPRIFQAYEARWKNDGNDGVCLPLSENFRSREALLKFINPLFRALMRPVIGGLHYDADAELRFGEPDGRAALSLAAITPPADSEPMAWPQPPEVSPRVELHVITKAEDSEANYDTPEDEVTGGDVPELQTTEREARWVARRLKTLKESGHRVWRRETGRFEPVEYRDMVVLLRGVAGRAEVFAKEFHRAGVPLHAERAGFLDAPEVTDLLNLLRLLDNPLQDVPLLAVLRSPLVGLTPDELVQVRLANRKGLLWTALNRWLAHGQEASAADGPKDHASRIAHHGPSDQELARKLRTFLEQFNQWREQVRHASLSHCLESALANTHYEALLLADERGAARRANVRRLVDLARRFDPYQREGLFRFLQFIAEQEAAEVRHEPAAMNRENAVRLMTIHASKGLEFPVVVLAGLGSRFNTRDLGGDILLNGDLGLCPKVLPPESRRRYPSIAHWLAAQRERRELLGEEMRLLYVAVTRARDTLILTGSATRREELARWQEPAPITDHALVKATGYLDWLRLWFAQWARPEEWSGEREGANDLLRWKFHDANDASFALPDAATVAEISRIQPPTTAELAALKELLTSRYPHEAATREPAKTSVSALRRRAMAVEEEAATAFSFQRFAARHPSRVASSATLSAAESGTAHHTFMELVSLDRAESELDLQNEAQHLQAAGALTAEEIAALDFGALAAFWQSELGRRVRDRRGQAQRELPFTARFQAGELRALNLVAAGSELPDDEFVVVQGFADLVVLPPGEIWLLDFKTDQAKAADLPAKVQLYEPQLKSYALALSRIYRRPVTECWLCFLAARKSIAVAI
ncbi:MAG: UvrD-helicase domain-containing protein [Verrucomicrobiae bacterium]|nr:UvrD-helicase domain-containing protein [Verrucomicrobiae bacterium]